MPGTSGMAHVSLVQADATVATARSRGQPMPWGSIAPHSASRDMQGLTQGFPNFLLPCTLSAFRKMSMYPFSISTGTYVPLQRSDDSRHSEFTTSLHLLQFVFM